MATKPRPYNVYKNLKDEYIRTEFPTMGDEIKTIKKITADENKEIGEIKPRKKKVKTKVKKRKGIKESSKEITYRPKKVKKEKIDKASLPTIQQEKEGPPSTQKEKNVDEKCDDEKKTKPKK